MEEIQLPKWEIEELSELVSKRVEDKLLARFGRWVVFNLILLGGVAGGGVVAFFNLRSEVQNNASLNQFQDMRITESIANTAAWRTEVNSKLDRVSDKIDILSSQLFTHNAKAAAPVK